MKEIIQKRFFNTHEYELKENHINVRVKTFRKTIELEIGYQEITGKRQRVLDGSITTYIIMRVSFVLVPVTLGLVDFVDSLKYQHSLIFLGIGLITLLFYFLSRNDFIKIEVNSDTYLYFYRKIPDPKSVEEFIKLLISNRDNYLKNRFLNFDKLVSYEDQKENLKLLLEFKVINLNEYQREETRLRRLFGNLDSDSEKPIGFLHN